MKSIKGQLQIKAEIIGDEVRLTVGFHDEAGVELTSHPSQTLPSGASLVLHPLYALLDWKEGMEANVDYAMNPDDWSAEGK